MCIVKLFKKLFRKKERVNIEISLNQENKEEKD